MIDCGANRSYASIRLGQRLVQWKKDKQCPYPLTMADGTPVDHDEGWVRKELRQVRLRIEDHEEVISLDIINLKYDIVFGMAWLYTHNPTVDWRARVLKFPQCSHGTETGGRSPLKVPIVRAI